MKKLSMTGNVILGFFSALLSLALLLAGCSKQAAITNTNVSAPEESMLAAKFFSLHAIGDADIGSIAKQIKQKNDAEHFLASFVQANGYILWNDAKKVKTPSRLLTLIPFAFENVKEVNGFVICRQDIASNTTTFDVFSGRNLGRYGFDEKPGKLNARDVQSVINYFNLEKFQTSSFRLRDSRLLPHNIRMKYPDLLNKEKLIARYRIKSSAAAPSVSLNANKTNALFDLSGCFGYWEEQDWWFDPDGEEDPCHCSGNERFAYTTSRYVSVCFDSGGGGYGFGDTGGGTDPGIGNPNRGIGGQPAPVNPGSSYDDSPTEYTDDDSDDSNADYTGPGVLIPSSITLANGNVVQIKFGISESDGKSANQLVAPRVIECLVFALNDLGNSNNTITSIEINCTTNGRHSSSASNHYKGLAVDIDMINGTVVNNSLQIANLLQLSLDKYSHIRENFGPFFKHKFGNPWPTAPDHNGHLHYSVNAN